MTNTLSEQRMISAHVMGRADYRQGKAMLCPVYVTDEDERLAYAAGWLGEARRHAKEIFVQSRAKRRNAKLFPKTFKPFRLESDQESN